MGYTILLMPKFDSTRREMGIDRYEDYDSDSIRFQQGYNIQEMTVEPGEKFTINNNWESAVFQCDGNMIRLITLNDWENDEEDDDQINLSPGNYIFHEDKTQIEKLSDIYDNDDYDDENDF